MVELKFHCSMPMFVARQWIRHRTANVNEYSGRYSLMPLLFYTPPAGQFALQRPVNNQGRQDQPAGSDLYRRGDRALGGAARAGRRRLRVAARERRRARDRAHRPAALDLHAVVLEDRPAQPLPLPVAARGSACAVGDPRVRRGDGGDRRSASRRCRTRRGSTTSVAGAHLSRWRARRAARAARAERRRHRRARGRARRSREIG